MGIGGWGGSIQPRSPLKFTLAVLLYAESTLMSKTKSPTDRRRDRWGWVVLGQGLRCFLDAVKLGVPVRSNLIAEPLENPANVVLGRREIVE